MEKAGKRLSPGRRWVLLLLTSGGFGLVVATICLLFFAFAIAGGVLPWTDRLAVYSIPAMLLGGLTGGSVCVRKLPSWRPIYAGLLGGGAFWVFLAVLGAFIYLRIIPTGGVLQSLLACMIGSVLSPLFAVKRKQRRR